MGLKASIEKLEDVAEPLREFYVPSEDKKSFVLAADGVEDVSGLKSTLKKERDALKAAQEALKTFDGVDAAAYRNWLATQEGDEEAKLFSSGKKEELKQRWTGKMQEAHQKELEKLQNEHKAEVEKIAARAKKFEGRVLENALRAATIEVEGFHKPATRDVLLLGRSVFVLDDDGNAVQKREDGTIVIGKDGKTPYSPKEWLESQRPDSPHWFSASASGTGVPPGRTVVNGSGQKTMTRPDFSKLNPQQQKDFVLKEKGLVVDA